MTPEQKMEFVNSLDIDEIVTVTFGLTEQQKQDRVDIKYTDLIEYTKFLITTVMSAMERVQDQERILRDSKFNLN